MGEDGGRYKLITVVKKKTKPVDPIFGNVPRERIEAYFDELFSTLVKAGSETLSEMQKALPNPTKTNK